MSQQQHEDESPRSDRRNKQRREKQHPVAAERRVAQRRKGPRRTLEWIEFYVQQHDDKLESAASNPAD
ncbi:MAG: hypothetical protein HY342_00055 [Candidatus Lambdaproteobacteria bacterium]|nr:hypothetical protein [Candidatus Lambdaproteobacteria bacterium]